MSIIFDALDKLEKTKKNDDSIVPDKQEDKNNKTKNILKSFLSHRDKKYLVYTVILISSFFIVKSGVPFLHKNNNLSTQEIVYSVKQNHLKSVQSSPNPKKDLNMVKILGRDSGIINNVKSKLVLNGIAFSFDSKDNFALINDTVVKEGDKINGEIVYQISEDWVELQTKDAKKYKLYSCYNKKK
ncbi:MAG: hypothetical protein ABIH18_05850 [Candidatus Omnitrophota bacterium]